MQVESFEPSNDIFTQPACFLICVNNSREQLHFIAMSSIAGLVLSVGFLYPLC